MLEVKNLAKSFGNRQILQNMNFSLKDGEILTVVGPSGAGKTTLLRIVAGLERADAGSMSLDGEKYDLSQEERGAVGVVFQDFNLFPNMSVLENITLAPQLALKEDKATAEAKAKEQAEKDRLPDRVAEVEDAMCEQDAANEKRLTDIETALCELDAALNKE